jgi:hypothetical protein
LIARLPVNEELSVSVVAAMPCRSLVLAMLLVLGDLSGVEQIAFVWNGVYYRHLVNVASHRFPSKILW